MKRTYDYHLAFSVPSGKKPEREGEQTFVVKPFCQLFADAALLAYHSQVANKDLSWAFRNACARSSILNSSFALESAANCCLARLDTSKQAFKELDHLATLGKFDVFLIARGADRFLDRGNKYVQAVADLIELRNAAVHAKHTTRKKLLSANITRSGDDIKHTPCLRIPLEHIYWTPDDAKQVLRSLCDFLNYYLLGLCKLPIPVSEAILCTEWHDAKGDMYTATQEFGPGLFKVESEWKLDLRFLHTWKRHTSYEKDGTEVVTLPAYPNNEVHRIPHPERARKR